MPQTPTPRLTATRARLLRARAGVEGLGTAGMAGLALKGVVVGLSFLFLKAVASLTGAEGLGHTARGKKGKGQQGCGLNESSHESILALSQ